MTVEVDRTFVTPQCDFSVVSSTMLTKLSSHRSEFLEASPRAAGRSGKGPLGPAPARSEPKQGALYSKTSV